MDKIPILRMGPFLLVTIQVDLYDRLALNLEANLVQMVSKTQAKGVLIDISAVEIVDSFMGRIIGNIGSMSRILDAETVVVGMQPAVAITLVELGLPLKRRSHSPQRGERHEPLAIEDRSRRGNNRRR